MAGNRSSNGNTSGRSKSHLANTEQTRFARACDAVTVCFRGQNNGKRTAENPLDTKASACIVVPGYADPDVLDIRRDLPTACREAIRVLLAISASKGREKWKLLTADVQAVFLKGGFQDKDRVLCCWPPKKGPTLLGIQLILKVFFGLHDAPRMWEKISKVLVQVWFSMQQVCLGLSTLHSSAGVLNVVSCLHVNGMWGTGDDLFGLKLEELDKLVGFGSMKRQKFDHCGRQYEKF